MSDTTTTATAPAKLAFVEGAGLRLSGADTGKMTVSEARSARAFSPELLAKIEGPPGEPAKDAATPPAAETPTEPAAAAAPAEVIAPTTEVKPDPPAAAPAPPVETSERDRLLAANAKLMAEADAARSTPAKPDRLETYRDLYYSQGAAKAFQHFIADVLETDPEHADTLAELSEANSDLTSHVLKVPLDEAKQAARNVALVKRSLARDQKARTAKEAKDEQSPKAAEHVAFIGNRLSLARPGTDGKPGTSLRDQYAVGAHLAPVISGKPFEEMILDSIPHLTKLGVLDPARANDDDYLVSETAKYLDHQILNRYQALADAFGKARPTPPSTAKTDPAPQPDATKSASQVPPQGHGGRSLTTANASTAPATLPSTKPTDQPTKRLSRAEFLRTRFSD